MKQRKTMTQNPVIFKTVKEIRTYIVFMKYLIEELGWKILSENIAKRKKDAKKKKRIKDKISGSM